MIDVQSNTIRFAPLATEILVPVATTGTSTDFRLVNGGTEVSWYTFSVTEDVYIHFGDHLIGAANTESFLLQQGTHDYMVKGGHGYRAIRVSADGYISVHKSGL